MTIKISFKTNNEMDKFYTDFLGNMPGIVSSAEANVKNKNVVINTIASHDDSFSAEKNLINNIKQYMQDNEINYNMTV